MVNKHYILHKMYLIFRKTFVTFSRNLGVEERPLITAILYLLIIPYYSGLPPSRHPLILPACSNPWCGEPQHPSSLSPSTPGSSWLGQSTEYCGVSPSMSPGIQKRVPAQQVRDPGRLRPCTPYRGLDAGRLESGVAFRVGATAATLTVDMTTAVEVTARFFFLPFLDWATKGGVGAKLAMKGFDGCWYGAEGPWGCWGTGTYSGYSVWYCWGCCWCWYPLLLEYLE